MKHNLKISWLRAAALAALLVVSITLPAAAQEVVDKTVAVVSDGSRSELITYSDLVWQLAMQPGIQLAPPRSDDLNRALQTLINQRIFALEAERLPQATPTEKEIANEINRLLAYFPSAAALEARLNQVGFDSVKDSNFERLIARRLSTEKYIDFRFRSFAVVSTDEEARYHKDVFVPDFRRRYPGVLTPTLDEKRSEIKEILTEQKVATRIENFLDDAKRRVQIEILIEV
ncbi:hypothetical protein BH10ACI3_BH10ACI3_11480 [soil metagenome]